MAPPATPPRFRPSLFDGGVPLPTSSPFAPPALQRRLALDEDQDVDDLLVHTISRKLAHVGLERINHPLENIPDAEIATLVRA